jgi:hypothetical protein
MEADYEPEFSVSPSDVLRNAGTQPQPTQEPKGYYPAQSMAYKQAGMSPLAGVAPLFMPQAQRAQMGSRAMGGGGGEQKMPSPFLADADFYASKMGDFAAAQSLVASKDGRSVFQMYDGYDFDLGAGDKNDPSSPSGVVKMRIVPKGEREGMGPDGKPFRIPVHLMARQNGVTTVPFRGGDESADKFRGLLSSGQGLMKNLNDLESIYKDNTFLTSVGPSEASAKARALEARILMDFSRVMSEAKGLGGQVSDRDLSVVEAMTPQRATHTFTRFKGNEMALLRQVRSMTLEKLRSTAQANGLDLLPEHQRQAKVIDNDKLLRKSKHL